MATSQMTQFIQQLRRTVVLQDGAERTDRQLLEDFISCHDKAALEGLVRRHGPMVWGVCRRVLGNHEDAEDAFQASFLVLIRKASSIASRELLVNWLYGVAHQTALKARATAGKRRTKEKQVMEMPEPATEGQGLLHDLQRLLDQELSRLPDKYRVVIVLCDLEGKTRKEAARQLAVPEGTIASRMATARTMLAKQLARHGLSVSGVALATMLSQSLVSAGVPTSVVTSTINAASFAAGQAVGVVSPHVAILTEGVMKAMLLTKLKKIAALLWLVACIGAGTGILGAWGQTVLAAVEGAESSVTAENDVGADVQAKERNAGEEPIAGIKQADAFAWGKEVDGLQAGVGFASGAKRSYSIGETVKPTIKLRNINEKATTVSYLLPPHSRTGPTVRDAKGKSVAIVMPRQYDGFPVSIKHTLKPGDEFNFEIARKEPEQFALQLPGGVGDGDFAILRVPSGTYTITYTGLLQSHPSLTTGATEIEVNAKDLLDKRVSRENEVRDVVDRFLKSAWAGETVKTRALASPAVSDQQVARFKSLSKALPAANMTITPGSASTSSPNHDGMALVVTEEIEVTGIGEASKGRVALILLKDDERLKTKGWLVWDIEFIELKDDAGRAIEVKNFIHRFQLQQKAASVLEGRWNLVSEEHNGEKRELMLTSYQFEFREKKATITWGNDGGNTGRVTHQFVVDSIKNPKELTITGDKIKIQAIYRLEKNKLTIATFEKPEDVRPKGFTVADAAGGGRNLVVRVLTLVQEPNNPPEGLIDDAAKDAAVKAARERETTQPTPEKQKKKVEGRGPIRAPMDPVGLTLDAEVIVTAVGQLRLGQGADIIVDGFPNKRFRGMIHTIQKAEPGKGAVTVAVEVLDADKRLAADMTADVQFLPIDEKKREKDEKVPQDKNEKPMANPPVVKPSEGKKKESSNADESKWKKNLNAAYQLKDGEFVKRVPVPSISEQKDVSLPQFPGADETSTLVALVGASALDAVQAEVSINQGAEGDIAIVAKERILDFDVLWDQECLLSHQFFGLRTGTDKSHTITFFYGSGRQQKLNAMADIPIRDGQVHGTVRRWSTDGTLLLEVPFVKGKIHGECRFYSHSGKLLGVSTLNNGTGKYSVWNASYEDPTLVRETLFVDGKEASPR